MERSGDAAPGPEFCIRGIDDRIDPRLVRNVAPLQFNDGIADCAQHGMQQASVSFLLFYLGMD